MPAATLVWYMRLNSLSLGRVRVIDFRPSEQSSAATGRVANFVKRHIEPAEAVYAAQRRELAGPGERHGVRPVLELLRDAAGAEALWNLFLPAVSGLSTAEYAPVAELTGWFPEIAPEALNCSAPDSGNMELLHLFATPEQRRAWLDPLLDGSIRSAFAMTEPDVAGSDASNISTSITLDGDDAVINGRKWWITGALDPRCRFFIVMGVSDPSAEPFGRQSFVIVPADTPGVTVERDLSYYGYHDQNGHGEVVFRTARVPRANVLGQPGDGFPMAPAPPAPGRIHHCMRAIGMAERAISLMKSRARERSAFGQPLARQAVVGEWIAEARITIEQQRLLALKTAWMIDQLGAPSARTEIAALKVAGPRAVVSAIDDAAHLHGA